MCVTQKSELSAGECVWPGAGMSLSKLTVAWRGSQWAGSSVENRPGREDRQRCWLRSLCPAGAGGCAAGQRHSTYPVVFLMCFLPAAPASCLGSCSAGDLPSAKDVPRPPVSIPPLCCPRGGAACAGKRGRAVSPSGPLLPPCSPLPRSAR